MDILDQNICQYSKFNANDFFQIQKQIKMLKQTIDVNVTLTLSVGGPSSDKIRI